MIKAIVNGENIENKKSFPKLMIEEDGSIVLMWKEEQGGVLSGKDRGVYYDGFDITILKDFHGSITLSNEDE